MNDNKQTTETYAVKLDSDVKSELQSLIREYNDQGTQGDFIKLLVDTFKTNKLSNTIVDSKADLRELNTLTTRIYGLYSNLIQRNSSSIEGIKSDVNEKLESKDRVIIELKEKIEELSEIGSIKTYEMTVIKELNESLVSEVEQLRDRASKDTILINKLNEEVQEIKELKSENKALTKKMKEDKEALDFLDNSIKELQRITQIDTEEITKLKSKIEDKEAKYKKQLKEQKADYEKDSKNKEIEHKNEIDNLRQSLESEKLKEILDIKESYQNEIKTLQDKNFEDREKLQDKYSERLDKSEEEKRALQQQIEELRAELDIKTENM